MEERKDDLLTRLRQGEKIICPNCHKNFLEPINFTNAPIEKILDFECPNCGWHHRWIPNLNLE